LPEIGQQRLRLLLQEATEQRLQQKMQPIQQAWDTAEPEEQLHRALFAALGAPNWSAPFTELVQRLPWSALQSWLRQPPAVLVLNCWLAGLDCVDCFWRRYQMLQICTENTLTGARSRNAWRIPIA
jgi:hypothetical protein